MSTIPAPPLPPPVVERAPARPQPPAVPSNGPAGAFLVELLIFNGHPFKDHWAYWVRSHANPDIGVSIHATGDVANGFRFEIKRSHDLREAGNCPSERVSLRWVDAECFNEAAMLNYGEPIFDDVPVCRFEVSVHKVKAPEKSLIAVGQQSMPSRKITQRNCQTWIIESADQLVADGIFGADVAKYLRDIEQ